MPGVEHLVDRGVDGLGQALQQLAEADVVEPALRIGMKLYLTKYCSFGMRMMRFSSCLMSSMLKFATMRTTWQVSLCTVTM
jgi:hypothetical protein